MGHCTGSSHRIGVREHPLPAQQTEEVQMQREARPQGPGDAGKALMRPLFISVITQTKPLWDLPSKCMQTTAHSCPCPGPGHRHLSPRLWQQLPHGPPCLYSQTSIPTLSDLILGPNHWHKSANASPVYLSSPGLTPECQTPLFHFLLSGSTRCVTHPQPLLVFPIQFPELLPASAQAKKP